MAYAITEWSLEATTKILIGIYIHYTHAHFRKQMSFLYTGGIKQIIPTKKYEDGGTSIFASGQGRCALLTVTSSFGI
jgi:hypothetical protein